MSTTAEQPVTKDPATDGDALEHFSCSAGPGPPWLSFCGRLSDEEPHDDVTRWPDCVVCLDIAAAVRAGRMACPVCHRGVHEHK